IWATPASAPSHLPSPSCLIRCWVSSQRWCHSTALHPLNALIGGQVDYMCNGIADIGEQVQTGTIKAYAVVATERHPILPNVPTTIEAGLPEFQALPWWALFAPKGVPQPILDALTDALDKALDDEHLRKRFSDLGGDIPGKERRGQQPLAALVKSEIARWTPIIKAANVTIG